MGESSLTCINGVCSASTTTAAPACSHGGEQCWVGASFAPPSGFNACCNGAPCGITSFTADATCSSAAGTKPCSPAGTQCTTGGLGTNIAGVTCCTGTVCGPNSQPTDSGPFF